MLILGSHTIDFQIHNNIEYNPSRKVRIYFFVSSIVSIVFICGYSVAIYKFNSQLVEIQSQVSVLNDKILTLNEDCDRRSRLTGAYATSSYLRKEDDPVESFEDATEKIEDYGYDYATEDGEGVDVKNRNRRANKKRGNRRNVKSSGILIFFLNISEFVQDLFSILHRVCYEGLSLSVHCI